MFILITSPIRLQVLIKNIVNNYNYTLLNLYIRLNNLKTNVWLEIY
jgi:hypothetical protein